MHEEKEVKDVTTSNKSVRLSDDTFNRFRSRYNNVEGASQETVLKELLDLQERITLETDGEFGSQIRQVNDLTVRIGEIFSSVIKQSNTKSELQEAKFEKLKADTSEEIRDLKDKLKATKEALEQAKKESTDNWHEKYKLEKDLEELKSDKQKHDVEYEERIAELKNAISEKDEKIASKNEKIDELEKQIEKVSEDISDYEELKKDVSRLEEDNKELKKQHATELENQKLESDKASFSRERKLQEDFNERLQAQINTTEEVRKNLDARRDEVTELNGKLSKLESQNQRLQEANQKLEDEIQQLKNQKS